MPERCRSARSGGGGRVVEDDVDAEYSDPAPARSTSIRWRASESASSNEKL